MLCNSAQSGFVIAASGAMQNRKHSRTVSIALAAALLLPLLHVHEVHAGHPGAAMLGQLCWVCLHTPVAAVVPDTALHIALQAERIGGVPSCEEAPHVAPQYRLRLRSPPAC